MFLHAELGVPGRQPVLAVRAVVPGAGEGNWAERGVDRVVPVAGGLRLVPWPHDTRGPPYPGSAASSFPSTPPPSFSIPARITVSAAL